MHQTQSPNFQRKIYSKSMKKLMGMTGPIDAETTRYLQQSRKDSRRQLLGLPALMANKTTNKTLLPRMTRQKTQKSYEKRLEMHDQTKDPLPTRLSPLLIQPSRFAKEVDNIMNEVITSHSPELKDNPAISRSISTKKFRNIRIKTETPHPQAPLGMRTSLLIKQILAFMMRNGQDSRHRHRVLGEDPQIYKQDLSRFSPLKLIKKSEEVIGLYPHHEFKRQQELYLNTPLDSQTYIKQLRSGKTFVKDLQLKRY